MRATAALGAGLFLILVFLTQGIFFIRANAPTYDEAMHLAAGYSYLATGDFRLERQNPPLIKEFLALPLFLIHRLPFRPDPQRWRDGLDFFVGQDFLYKSPLPADAMLALSRLANLLLGGFLVALLGWWAYRLWGHRAALLAMTLASFEPNLVAHSSLVTTDIGVTLFIFLTIYLLWEYLNFRTWWSLAAAGVSLGVALVCKFSAVLLIPIIVLIIALSLFAEGNSVFLLRPRQNRPSHRLLDAAAVVCILLFFASIMIPPAYFVQGFLPWLTGFYRFLTFAREGQPAFFLGELSYLGWWNYFVVAFLIKTPLGTLILITASLVFYRAGSSLKYREALFLFLPVILIFVATSQAKVNIGVRHILPVYPFLFLVASRLATIQFSRRWLAHFAIAVPLVFATISSVQIAPHQLAYFNEIVGGPAHGHRYLADSNLDWGQDLKGVKDYMAKESLPIIYLSYFGSAPPSYYGIRYQYVPGTWPLEWPPPVDRVPASAPRKVLAISTNNLHDVFNSYNPLFRWLLIREPVAKIGYSIFVYDLTDDQEGLTKLHETYVKAGITLPP